MGILTILILALVLWWILSKLRTKSVPPTPEDGFVTARVSLAEILPPELAQLEEEDHFVVRVAGVTHQNDDGSSRQEILSHCKVPEILQLVRQPNHRHDKNAIQVQRQNAEMLGFIPKNDARLMAPEMDRGRRFIAVLTTLDGGYGYKRARGAGVLIVKIAEQQKPQ